MPMIRRVWARVLQLSQTKRNLFANLFGNGWAALIQLIAIPIYANLLGSEAYGLFAFYLTIVGLVQVFDFGFSPTINRELAKYTAHTDQATEARTLTRTMEIIYIFIGVMLGIGLALLSPFIANSWLQTTLDATTVQVALLLMACLIVVQWPLTFYQGGINGLQKQTRLVSLQAGASVIKHGGGMIVLLMIPNIFALLTWMIFATAIQTMITMLLLWQCLPASLSRTKPRLSSLNVVGHFATGSALTAIAAIPLTMSASLLLSSKISLSEFGYYTIAVTYASVIVMIFMPVVTAIYPRLTALVVASQKNITIHFFRFSGQFMAAIVIPFGLGLIFYAQDLLHIWQRDSARATAIAPIAAFLAAGNIFSGLLHIPYSLQLATGNTRINLILTIVIGILQLPILIYFIDQYSGMGAAISYLSTNFLLFLLHVVATDRMVMKFGIIDWISKNVCLPAVAAGLIFVITNGLAHSLNTTGVILVFGFITITAAVLSALSMNMTRNWAVNKIIHFWGSKAT